MMHQQEKIIRKTKPFNIKAPSFLISSPEKSAQIIYNTIKKGKEIVYCPTGLQSVVFQHEYDHLDGILFPERMNSITKDIFMKKINKEFK